LTKRDHATKSRRLQLLAEFRHELRKFLHFSEQAAANVKLQSQHHQLLLQLAGAPDGTITTIVYAAERLGLRHNTVVELSNRCEEAGLIRREPDVEDHRRIILKVTPKGYALLDVLSEDHAHELNERAPRLIRALQDIQAVERVHAAEPSNPKTHP